MKKIFLKQKWIWLIYIIFFGGLIGQRLHAFFSIHSFVYLYYHILIIFSINQNIWPLSYIFAISSLLWGCLAVMMLLFYMLDRSIFSTSFIISVSLLRLVSDILGHSYEWMTIRSLFFQSQTLSAIAASNLILCLIPSYLAMGDAVLQSIKNKRNQPTRFNSQ